MNFLTLKICNLQKQFDLSAKKIVTSLEQETWTADKI